MIPFEWKQSPCVCVCVWPHYEAAVLAVVGVVTAAVVAAVVVACMKMSKDYDYFKSINKVWQSHKKCTQFNETSLSTNCPSRDKFWFYIRLLHMSPAMEYSWARTFFRTVIWLVSFYIYIYVCKGITIIQLKNFYICTVYSKTEIQSNSFTIHSERTAQCWCWFFFLLKYFIAHEQRERKNTERELQKRVKNETI